jgi:hypothetical protein
MIPRFRRVSGLTLIEMVVATLVSSAMLVALITGAVALQRGYSAVDHQVRSQEDQMRAVDFLTRDLHRASTIEWSNQGRLLTVTVPDQSTAPALPVDLSNLLHAPLQTPNIVDGILSYGGSPTTIAYYLEGGDFLRVEGGARKVISRTIEEFLGSTAGSLATFQLAFTPKFRRGDPDKLRAGTRVQTTVYLRNVNRSR